MPSLTPRQAQVLAAIQQLQESNALPITRDKLAKITHLSKENVSRIIYSVRKLYPEDSEYMLRSHPLQNKQSYELNTANVVTTRAAARVLCELKKAVIAAGVIDREEFEKRILSQHFSN